MLKGDIVEKVCAGVKEGTGRGAAVGLVEIRENLLLPDITPGHCAGLTFAAF